MLKSPLKKIASTLGLTFLGCSVALTTMAAQTDNSTERYVIKYKTGNADKIKNTLRNNQANIHIELNKLNAVSATLSSKALEALQKNPNIEYIEKEVYGRYFAQITPYSNPMIQADLLTTSGSSNMKVCIIDTGIDLAHEDFDSSLITGSKSSVENTDWFTDEQGHGTYMSGAIIALNNDIGVVGIAPSTVALHFHKMGMDFSGTQVAEGILECVNQGANAISMSFGTSKSQLVQDAVTMAYNLNVLLMASAGNDENTTLNYPSSYDEVMSIAGVDKHKAHATYSNWNAQVEIAAPATLIWGTAPMGERVKSESTFNNQPLESIPLHGSALGSASGEVVDCGNGRKVCGNAVGKICLIKAPKAWITSNVQNCEAGGGVGVLVYNDALDVYLGNVGFDTDGATAIIPGADITDADAAMILSQPLAIATLNNTESNYVKASGTSLSSPIVAGAAAVVWGHHLNCTNAEIRNALNVSAEDLGASGRDDYFGHGLVQMAAANSYLDANPCGVEPPPAGIELSATKTKTKGKWDTNLSWMNLASDNVDIYRDGSLLITTTNNGSYSEPSLIGTHGYQVCEEATNICSEIISITL